MIPSSTKHGSACTPAFTERIQVRRSQPDGFGGVMRRGVGTGLRVVLLLLSSCVAVALMFSVDGPYQWSKDASETEAAGVRADMTSSVKRDCRRGWRRGRPPVGVMGDGV